MKHLAKMTMVYVRAGVSAKIFETETLNKNSRLERAETETRHETFFETKRWQYFANIFDGKFWTFGELPFTLQHRFLGISLLYEEQAN